MTRHFHLHFSDAKPRLVTRMVRDKNGRPHYMVVCDKRYVGRITPDGVNYAGFHHATGKVFPGPTVQDCLSKMQKHHDSRRR